VTKIKFTPENRRKIFGTYAGEEEDIERLKQYYVKSNIYESIVADLPFTILVGNKGVGKSALFKVAIAEAKENGEMPIVIKPDDVADIGEKHESILLTIRKWKFGLIDLIAKNILSEIGLEDPTITRQIIPTGGKVIKLLIESIEKLKEAKNLSAEELAPINNFLSSKKIIIFLDDLDRGWQNRKEGINMISALIAAIRDLSTENRGLIFKVALRLDVFNAVRVADESSDKYEGAAVTLSYKLPEIFILLVKRILTFWGQPFDESKFEHKSQKSLAQHLESVFDLKFAGKGTWDNAPIDEVLLSLVRNRPRDMVKLCVMAAKEAFEKNSSLIKTEHINAILSQYSKSIMDDTIAEYRSELPSIERLLYGMKPAKMKGTTKENFVFTTAEIHLKIYNVIQLGALKFANGFEGDAHTIKEFLYKIHFLTARKTMTNGTKIRKHYEENSNLSSLYMDEGYDWEIHMAYRWVLQPESLDDILSRISKS
jgi:hypothetical protein